MKISKDQLKQYIHTIINEDAEDMDSVVYSAVNIIIGLLYQDKYVINELNNKILILSHKDTKIELLP